MNLIRDEGRARNWIQMGEAGLDKLGDVWIGLEVFYDFFAFM